MKRAQTSPNLAAGDEGGDNEPDSPLSGGGGSRGFNRSKTASFGDLARTTGSIISQESKLLEATDAFKYSTQSAPSFTMRPRGKGSFFPKPSVDTEFGPDISKQVDYVRASLIRPWTMQPRPKKSALDGSESIWVPAPGTYPQKTTVEKTHPTIPMGGRGWHWGSSVRSPALRQTCAPDPTRYQPKDEFAIPKDPKWSIGKKLDYDPDKMDRKLYDTRDSKRKGGKAGAPSWSFTGRGKSSLVPVGSGDEPGPGAHRPHKDIGGKMKRQPSWGFGTSSRWGKEPEMRPY
eukprot:TRINITY_DN53902_c0_g1_i1.p1 TRINITY_DN53902_c0_g1~~TRINITY_DN53902_c0_g1_i1.p1  ORF type:complete len:289 (+),score=23.85 TRINITY_DN53902_c0_g1_i1:33-899(+)